VDKEQLQTLRHKLQNIRVPSLTMAQESLAECLVKRQWYNPLPRIRYTERPDCVAACVNEGKIVLLVDNSAAAMIVPTSFVEFLQDTNDFCFPPMIGTYLRVVRSVIFWATLLLMPLWFLLIQNPTAAPEGLRFLLIKAPNEVPVYVQILITELIIDGIKLASLNTPNALNNAFSVVGGLILGEFAVSAGVFVPEVLLYMAFSATANFTQPNFELGYAFKLFRMMLVTLTALFNYIGFAVGIGIVVWLLFTTETVTGKRYLYPVFPFHGKALLRQLLRMPIDEDNC
jgi:stage V sporulation protein AF